MRGPLVVVVVALAGCVSIDNPLLDAGTSSGGGSGSTGGGATAGGGSTGGGSAGGGGSTGGGTGGGGACTPDWTCSAWEPSGTNQATRTCLDSNACGVNTGKPSEGPTALPALDLNFYKCRVQPVVDLTCAMIGCHGKEADRAYRAYARGRLRADEPVCGGICNQNCGVMVSARDVSSANHHCSGRNPLTMLEWSRNFDRARASAVGAATPADAEFLTQPLAGSSFAHAGVKVFSDTNDPRYQTLLQWLSGATLATCVTAPN
ncbi:MAG: hypothetical protein JNM17_08965 [Archangium sp.]|nr:hypothetical protein [Archangium sp.]